MMRWRFLCCLWLCFARLASAAPALVQSDLGFVGAGADSLELDYTSAVSANQLLFVYCAALQLTAFSTADAVVTDTLGNTWTVTINVGPGDGGTGDEPERLWGAYTVSGSSGSNSVTCDPPGSSNYITMVVLAMSGVQTTTPLDRTAENNLEGGSTTPTSGTTLATTVADAIMVAGMLTGSDFSVSSITASGPCTVVQEIETWVSFQSINICSYVVTSTGTQAASWTLDVSQTWAAAIAAFKGAAVAASVRRGSPIVFP